MSPVEVNTVFMMYFSSI